MFSQRKPKVLVAIRGQGRSDILENSSARWGISELAESRVGRGRGAQLKGCFKIYALRRYARQFVSGDWIDEVGSPGSISFTPLTVHVKLGGSFIGEPPSI